MPIYFQRPENALKRANEFIDVGKKEPALDVLYDVIKSKKHRTWQKIHEPILFKYLELCVDLKRSHIAKEGLYQYRLICQHVNVNSLECVIRHFLQLAEDRASRAQGESREQVTVDDLDNIQTPESVLLSFVSGEDVQDRTDRILLTPWLKFLWEAYRNVLELLRNNIRVEKLYHETAQQAFKFCLKYTRRTEFRKLCDNIRNHLTNVMKNQGQPNAINLSNPDTLQMHLETRLAQLDSAVNMELWQEAFKAVEDIHGLMQLSKKHPKPQVMANYYQKVALVFWKADNYLFHAAALQKLLVLSREQKKTITPEEVKKMASKVLLATLSVPIPPPVNDSDKFLHLDDISREKTKRLSVLLSLQGTPSRQLLVKDLVKMNVIQFAIPELQDLFTWLEEEFHPLHLCSKVASVLDFLKENEDLELSQYIKPIQKIAVMRVLKQVSQVYQSVQFTHLLKMIPFASEFELEQIVVDAANEKSLQVRLDHRTKSLSFGTDLCVGNLDGMSEGPHLQAMTSEKMHSQLMLMSQALQKAMRIIKPCPLEKDRNELREHLVQSYLRTARKEHQQMMQRKVIIEARKEHQENIHNERERREHQEMERQRQKAMEAERKRLEEEARLREQQRKQRELMEIEKKQALEKINALKKTTIGARALKDLTAEEIEDMDADDIIARQVEQLDRDKKEMQSRLKSQEKRVDYLARAIRTEEIPLLKKAYDDQLVKDKEFWEKEEELRISTAIAEHEKALSIKSQLERMVDDKNAFVKVLQDQRMAVYEEKIKGFNEELEAARKERLEKRRKQRLVERKQKFLREKEEARLREEEEKRKKEEEEQKKKEREEREAREREYKEQLAKLEEQARKQREREMEIEEKLRKKQEKDIRPDIMDQREPAWRDERGGGGGGGWRGRDERDFGDRRDMDRGDRWGPPRDSPGPWRRGGDDRGPPGRGPPPEDRAWRRGRDEADDRGPPPRVDRGPNWRSRGFDDDERGPPPRDDRPWRGRGRDDGDERGPPRDDRPAPWRLRGRDDEDRGPPPRDDRGPAWRPRGRDDERGPPPRDDRGPAWRSRGDEPDGRGPPPGDDRPPAWRPRGGAREDDGPPPRDDKSAWRREDDRGPPMREGPPSAWRRGGDRDERGPPPRDDRWRGGPEDRDRGPRGRWGDRDGGESEWRRGRDDDQGRRDDDRRSGPWRGAKDDDRERPGRWGDRGDDRSSWRERTDDRPSAMKDDRDMGRREPPKEGRSWQAARVRRNETEGGEGDGWTVVEKK